MYKFTETKLLNMKPFAIAVVLLCATSVLLGCKKIEEVVECKSDKIYIIEANAHEASNKTPCTQKGTVLRFVAKFDQTGKYSTKDPANQSSINKLYGFSDCGDADHHKNSARFGWAWNKTTQKMDIYAYCYVNQDGTNTSGGANEKHYITSVDLDKEYEYKIEAASGKYIFTINGKTKEVPRHCSGEQKNMVRLFPYFGGTEPAPQRITIYIKDL
jgi:hypothetical protein